MDGMFLSFQKIFIEKYVCYLNFIACHEYYKDRIPTSQRHQLPLRSRKAFAVPMRFNNSLKSYAQSAGFTWPENSWGLKLIETPENNHASGRLCIVSESPASGKVLQV